MADAPALQIYELREDISVEVKVGDIERWSDQDVVVVYFDMSVEAEDDYSASIELGRVKTRYDGVASQKTWVKSLANYEGNYVPRALKSGLTTFHLYSVFPSTVSLDAGDSFVLEETGVELLEVGKEAPDSPRWGAWIHRPDIRATIGDEPVPVFQDPVFHEDFVIYDRHFTPGHCWIISLDWQDISAAGCGMFREVGEEIALKPEAMLEDEARVRGNAWFNVLAVCDDWFSGYFRKPEFEPGVVTFWNCDESVTMRFSREFIR